MEIGVYDPEIDFESTLSLYAAEGWTAYAGNPERLREALANSSLVLISTRADRVVGLVRCISDGQTICYIQDILVVPEHQRFGIGKSLMQRVLNHYVSCRQIVLVTDAEKSQRRFYESSGFREIAGDLGGYVLLRSRAFPTPTAPLPF